MNVVRRLSGNGGQPLVDLIYFDAGGGHRAAATALKAVAEQQRRHWRIRMVNLRDVLEPIDFIRRFSRVRVEEFYNAMLRSGLTACVNPLLSVMHLLIRRMHSAQVRTLAQYWQNTRPDLVVSLVPHFNRAIFEGLRVADMTSVRLPTPMVTILTDPTDYPPNFWIERQEQYFICGTGAAAQQALAMGHSDERVLRVSGMIVRPEFYQPLELRRADERTRLGLSPYLPTGLVMFGGFGSRRMVTIARRVAETGLRTQLIFMCGHNHSLRQRLAALDLPFPHHIVGFTREIPYFMRLADYFISKPGPGSISEALVMKLPVIVDRNASTMVQERYNSDWVLENGVGIVLRSFSDIAEGVRAMLDAARHATFRFKLRSMNNRAVFEIPDILETLMASGRNEIEPQVLRAQA
jgi:Glycosyltransferase family 28 C-terminal domain/Monogalactosyldiacylglycerol (MGDG) synthase